MWQVARLSLDAPLWLRKPQPPVPHCRSLWQRRAWRAGVSRGDESHLEFRKWPAGGTGGVFLSVCCAGQTALRLGGGNGRDLRFLRLLVSAGLSSAPCSVGSGRLGARPGPQCPDGLTCDCGALLVTIRPAAGVTSFLVAVLGQRSVGLPCLVLAAGGMAVGGAILWKPGLWNSRDLTPATFCGSQ